MLAHHPGPDVPWTITKDNTSAGFVLSQEADCVTIGEHQIGKIQHKDTAGRLCIDYLAQLVHRVGVKLTADREHYLSAAGAMNFQHRPRRFERNCRAIRKVPERTGVWQSWRGEISPMVKCGTTRASRTLWRSRAKAAFIDLQCTNL
jgi:hypothetical protein